MEFPAAQKLLRWALMLFKGGLSRSQQHLEMVGITPEWDTHPAVPAETAPGPADTQHWGAGARGTWAVLLPCLGLDHRAQMLINSKTHTASWCGTSHCRDPALPAITQKARDKVSKQLSFSNSGLKLQESLESSCCRVGGSDSQIFMHFLVFSLSMCAFLGKSVMEKPLVPLPMSHC